MASSLPLQTPNNHPFTHRLRAVVRGNHLDERDVSSFLGEFMDGNASAVQAAAFLSALATKGETVSEIMGAARAMRARSIRVPHDLPLVMDLCGTGGDHSNTLNISTMASFVVAAAGIPVAKHGNRAASSQCGSADVLEAAGFPIAISPGSASTMLTTKDFTFLFAPLYHPAMRNVAPVRRELPIRTIFNILGPLTNPASVTHQLVGVAHPALLEVVGNALRALGIRAGAVVHAHNGIDEVAGDGLTSVFAFDECAVRQSTIDPSHYGIAVPLNEIQGGTPEYNAAAFVRILKGERSGAADVVALNAALALQVAGAASDLREALHVAFSLLESGIPYEVFSQLRAAV